MSFVIYYSGRERDRGARGRAQSKPLDRFDQMGMGIAFGDAATAPTSKSNVGELK